MMLEECRALNPETEIFVLMYVLRESGWWVEIEKRTAQSLLNDNNWRWPAVVYYSRGEAETAIKDIGLRGSMS